MTSDPNDPPPTPCLDLPRPHALGARAQPARAAPRASERSALDALDEALRRPPQRESTPAPTGERALVLALAHKTTAHFDERTAPAGDLPDLATRIDEAQRQARARRVQQGLPPDPDDGAYALKRPRKHAPKRGKKHGQFLGTVCDSWEDKTRAR